MRTQFAWLIEAAGPSYLAARKLGCPYEFYWSNTVNKALRFCSHEQADLTMMALRELSPKLFAFASTLGDAKAVEHGWLPAANRHERFEDWKQADIEETEFGGEDSPSNE